MADYLKTAALITAVRDRLKTGLSFDLTVVEFGSLMHWTARKDPTAALPAVFVEPVFTEPEPIESGHSVRSTLNVRVVYVDEWDDTTDVTKLKVDRGTEIWSRLAGDTGQDWYLGGAVIPDYQFDEGAVPATIEWVPQEQAIVSKDETRRLFAVAIRMEINGRVTR